MSDESSKASLENAQKMDVDDEKTSIPSLPKSSSSWGEWLTDVAQNTVNKASSTIEYVKQDLTEFTDVMSEQAAGLANATVSTLKNQAAALNSLVTIDAEDLHEDQESTDAKKTPAATLVREQPQKNTPTTSDAAMPPTETADTEHMSSVSDWWNSLKSQATAIMQDIDESVAENVLQLKSDENPPTEGADNAMQETSKHQAEHADSGWMKNILSTVNKALYMDDTTRGEDEITIPIRGISSTRKQTSRLFTIENDISTYADEPCGAPELFDDWCANFDIHEHGDEIEHLMNDNVCVKQMYAKLVPGEVSAETFWRHYFYRLHAYDLDELRRSEIQMAVDEEVEKLAKDKKNSSENSENTGTTSPMDDQWSVCSSVEHNETGEHNKHAQIRHKHVDEKVTRDTKTPTLDDGQKHMEMKDGEWVDWTDEDDGK